MDTHSAMFSRSPGRLDPGHGDVARKNLAPVEDALQSVLRASSISAQSQ